MGVTAETVRQAFEAYGDNDQPVTRSGQVPTSYNSLTREWLSDVICKGRPGAQVTDFSFDGRDDGSSNRRRLFLSYNDAGRETGLPASVFCKAAESLESRIILGIAGTARGEANFYNKVRPRLALEAPTARYAGFDPTNYAYFVMMDDIGSSVRFVDERDIMTRAQAEAMVTTLAQLHSAFYESPELGGDALPFSRFPQCWSDIVGGAPGFADFCDEGFATARPVMSDKLFARRSEIWAATERSVQRHHDLPQTLIHSDVHWKNWYVTPDDRLGLADWQLVTIGHWSRDFVFALTTALSVDQRRAWFEDLLALYIRRMAERGVPEIPFKEALLNVRQQIFTALAFWTITLRPTGDMPAMQPERTALEFLRRMLATIDDYDALDAF